MIHKSSEGLKSPHREDPCLKAKPKQISLRHDKNQTFSFQTRLEQYQLCNRPHTPSFKTGKVCDALWCSKSGDSRIICSTLFVQKRYNSLFRDSCEKPLVRRAPLAAHSILLKLTWAFRFHVATWAARRCPRLLSTSRYPSTAAACDRYACPRTSSRGRGCVSMT